MDQENVKKEKVKIELIPHDIEAPKVEEEPVVVDDRLEEIEVVFGPKPNQYMSEILPKKQALEKLVNYYQNSGGKMVPKNRANLNDGINTGQRVNQDTVYMKFTKWDSQTGKEVSTAKDVPLWIAADRIVNSSELGGWRRAEMITKSEYEEISSKREDATGLKDYRPTSFYKRT